MATKPIVFSITIANGLENMRHKEASDELGSNWYFWAPHRSREKGTVENKLV
jgi:IS30 family transposase